jgi:pSer/pThr/pTyr-binding forkhead associated (FHA) protein
MPDFAEHGFHIRYGKRAERGAKPAPAGVSSPLLPAIRLTVLSGQAAQNVYEVQRQAITVGRLAELFDARQRLTRRNDVAFDDSEDPPNNTVSRAHAHLRYDAEAGGFRLFDDGSAHGTGVFRDGRLAQVPAGSRGFRLQSGDEIYFGQARVRFETVGTL